MSIKYVDDIYMDLGEKIHMLSLVRPVCGKEIPFEIQAARWELYREDWERGGSGSGSRRGMHSQRAYPGRPDSAGNICQISL